MPNKFYPVLNRASTLMQLCIVATALVWLAGGNYLWFAVGLACAALACLPGVCLEDLGLRTASGLCATSLLFAHVVFGMQANLYETSQVYDKLMHALGSGAITALVIFAMLKFSSREGVCLPLPLFTCLVLATAVSLGTIWEVFEFAIDRTGLFRSQRGLTDTMLDLIANAGGALTATAIFAALFKFRDRAAAYNIDGG
ncbi:hypothetical protein HPQ64_15755 [Rhizobiales bacterium]|uniref:hypothetical protein n=1 Tax=Hongsoonwoonella zoysiae TaxID=2821844 RepID=UPI001560A8C5|nr:hypothetical protein [Hongsoonwoonella zoysiae]NRG19146.1 hypothetical protein [Hongsoonwoonella zoysiae]